MHNPPCEGFISFMPDGRSFLFVDPCAVAVVLTVTSFNPATGVWTATGTITG